MMLQTESEIHGDFIYKVRQLTEPSYCNIVSHKIYLGIDITSSFSSVALIVINTISSVTLPSFIHGCPYVFRDPYLRLSVDRTQTRFETFLDIRAFITFTCIASFCICTCCHIVTTVAPIVTFVHISTLTCSFNISL